MLSKRSWVVVLATTSLIYLGNAFVVPRRSTSFSLTSTTTTTTCLQAKKKKSAPSGQGFGKTPPPTPVPQAPAPETTASDNAQQAAVGSSSTPLQSIESGGSDVIPTIVTAEPEMDPNLSPEERAKALLRDKYGLRTREEQDLENKKEEKRKEARKRQLELQKMAELDKDVDLMAMLPAPVLIGIDRFLKIGTGITTVAFVAAGLAITAEAWANASGNPLPPDVDEFITNVVEPNFTPGLLVLLGFSISLGVFAAAQLGSDSSQYRETGDK